MTLRYYDDSLNEWFDTFNNNCSSANNGDTSITYKKDNCVRTDWNDRNPHWTVDLGTGHFVIHHVVVFAVGNATNEMTEVRVAIDGNLVYTFASSPADVQLITDVPVYPPRQGRNVTLSRHDIRHGGGGNEPYTYLRFCEVQVWGTCAQAGHYGVNCDQHQCGAGCQSGTCDPNTGHCTCTLNIWAPPLCSECAAGHFGPNCGSACGAGCSGHTCDRTTGHCTCSGQNWASTTCDSCASGYYDKTSGCTHQCGHCVGGSTSCDVNNGHCPSCAAGYLDPLCQQACTAGSFGNGCTQHCGTGCSGTCTSYTGCHTCNNEDGTCTCRQGWADGNGVHCTVCARGYYNKTSGCTHQCGHCAGGPQACDTDTGHCPAQCTVGFQPPLCSQACSPGLFGPGCSQHCGTGCNGTCNSNDGSCTCRQGWADDGHGGHCNVCARGYYDKTNDCTHQCGHCSGGPQACDIDTGECSPTQCIAGYQLPLCQQECVPGTYGVDCRETCGAGCVSGTCDVVNGTCICLQGWADGQAGHCSECADHYYNISSRCSQTCGQCSGGQACDKVSGQCDSCQPGYVFPLCQHMCDDGRYGQNCSGRCGQCKNGQPCDKTDGHCLHCEPGLKPPDCKTACDVGNYGEDCRDECGFCANGAACDTRTGICPAPSQSLSVCDGGYQPPYCKPTTEGLYWEPHGLQESGFLLLCPGDNAYFNWRVRAGHRITQIINIEWFYAGNSRELMGLVDHDHFIILPAFSGRLQHFGNASIMLSDVVAMDSGNYSVEVIATEVGAGHSTASLYGDVVLRVAEEPVLTNKTLVAVENSQAVLDPRTGQWSIELLCGTFQYLGDPPVHMVWRTPNETKPIASSSYRDGQFRLLLTHPIQGGQYTCLPKNRSFPAEDGCLKSSASVTVDGVADTMILYQAEIHDLKNQLNNTTSCTCP